ncbi:MAG: N-6 DNA methylase [Planctomycetota bacterium]|nr:N-6 DNA methylase [Planctomycetota bacterium]
MPRKRSVASNEEYKVLAFGTLRPNSRRRRALILPTRLREESSKTRLWTPDAEAAHGIVKRWADLAATGKLHREISSDAEFLNEVFGDALGYTARSTEAESWQLDRQTAVPGAGKADGALGRFQTGDPPAIVAVIEMKGADADLDRDRSSGRTPVQQCWDYLNALPECPWGIVSNFQTIRLYHRDKTPLAYEEFRLQELRDLKRFRDFYCLFGPGGLMPAPGYARPRAGELLALTERQQREVGEKLYQNYSDQRSRLIVHLREKESRSTDEAIHIAQKLLDRIVFIAFCEDRGLLPGNTLDKAYKQLPPFQKVTNPRWQNFKGLFHAVDRGHPSLDLETGYNGGLFRHDPLVDDLELDDEWTNFFRGVGDYDFRDEVNVDVLGHLFEKSITELEKFRAVGLFAAKPERNGGIAPAMNKSAERKRFGVYYTPPEFTAFLVNVSLQELLDERLDALRKTHKLPADRDPDVGHPFWNDALAMIRGVKVVDPACGSGAFLIRAYDVLEEYYARITDSIGDEAIAEDVPDYILSDNLYGVDLSPQAVEITQLALWVRSARKGRTLADLSANILCANSLIEDAAVDPRGRPWPELFPAVFDRPEAGFDVVIGNPPWERLKLQEREFFAFRAPGIAQAVSAADRRKKIVELEAKDPELYAEYRAAQQRTDGALSDIRTGGRFPLTGRGDLNTYALFAELARRIVAPHGRIGLLIPSGIATDNTTQEFFADLMEKKALRRFYDFENKKPHFPDVHRSFKFAVFNAGGRSATSETTDFAFFLRDIEELDERKRHIALTEKDLRLLNPNTRNCPIFRSRRDAELTKAIYRRVPVLIDESRKEGGNAWGVRFFTMFHQTNDAEKFLTAIDMKARGYKRVGNRWVKGKRVALPLYEAKMVQAFDHRAAGVIVTEGNWVRQGQTEATTVVSHQNPEFTATPRWWVEEAEVASTLGDESRDWFLCYKDVTSATNQRTMIAAFVPRCGVVNSAPLMLTDSTIGPRYVACLLANLNAFVYDYVARQKVGGVHLNFFIVKQLPTLSPDRYNEPCPWEPGVKLLKWISERSLTLSCTAEDLRPLAEAAKFKPPVRKWNPRERAELRAELDAAFFLLYGVNREDAEYVLSTFRHDQTDEPLGADPAALTLKAYDRLSEAGSTI